MFKGRTFNRNTAKDYRQQPRSGVRIQPTAQAVGGTWKTAEPQRRERSVVTQLETARLALLVRTQMDRLHSYRKRCPRVIQKLPIRHHLKPEAIFFLTTLLQLQ